MTTKTVSTYSATGYTLSPSYSELDITKTGGFGGDVYSGHYATISNAGTIVSTTTIGLAIGVLFGPSAGGVVINRPTGSIYGRDNGVFSDTTLRLENYGRIQSVTGAVVEANTGGSVTNGNYANLGATIAGSSIRLLGTPGTLTNFGTITAFVFMNKGGTVINGGALDATALLDGGGGIYLAGAAGAVSNFGTVSTYGTSNGVNLGAGGRVTNGAVSDTTARIEGFTGVLLSGAGTVSNFGTINGAGGAHGGYGVILGAGGKVTNGGGMDTGALLQGYTGVQIGGAAGTVVNSGTIAGLGYGGGQYGIYLKAGGSVTNGGGANHAALIEGADGVATASAGAATVSNFGTILAAGATGVGVSVGQGSLVNGSLNNGAALVEGYTGAVLNGSASSTNFGTISGLGDHGGWGVVLGGSESLVNAQGRRLKAAIEGYGGVLAMGTANTLINFATISGAGGTAVKFASAGDVLEVWAGCAFDGAVLGGGGTVDLASGTGTISNFTGGNVTVSGSMAATTFQSFGTVEVGAGATFADTGAVTIAASQTVIAAGTLTLGGSGAASIVNAGLIETTGTGMLTLAGAVSGSGTDKIGGGTLFAASTFNQPVTFNGATGVLELAKSQTYTTAIRGFSKTGGTSLDLNDIAFGGSTKASFSGTATSGTLTVTDGTRTAHLLLIGDYRTSTFVAASDGHGGTTIHDPTRPAPHIPAPPWIDPALGDRFIAAAAALGGSADAANHTREIWAAPGPVLTKPGVMMA